MRVRTGLAGAFAAACCVIAAHASEFTVYNIVPFSPGHEAEAAADAIELREKAGVDRPLYSLTLDPCREPLTNQIVEAIASYRVFRAALEGSDVRPGILVQAILGHAWRGEFGERNPPVAGLTQALTSTGKRVRYCPLDPRFAEYIDAVFTAVACEKPSFILTDDDVRSYSHGAECFCMRHVALFNARRGTNLTADELRARIAAAKPGDPDYEAFFRLQREKVEGVLRRARAAIDRVDPTIPAGISVAGQEHLLCAPMARIIAARGQRPVMRAACSNYLKRMSAVEVPLRFARMQTMVEYYRDADIDILCETDTWPHNLWSKTGRSFFTHTVLGAWSGMAGAKAWCVNAHKKGRAVNRNYTKVLAENRGFLDALAREVKDSEPTGVSLLCLTNFPNWHAVNGQSEFFFAEGAHFPFVPFTVPFGIPYRYTRDFARAKGTVLQMADEVKRLSDADLRNLFAGKVLVFKDAAEELERRGFGGASPENALFTDYRYDLPPQSRFSEEWKHKFIEAADSLAGEKVPFVVGQDQDVLVQSRVKPDGTSLVLAVNLASDPIDRLSLRYPGADPTVERLQGDGTWKRIGCLREGDYLSLDASLAFEEAAVFRFSPLRPVRVTFTFDDGVRDHWAIAARMLEERGWRGTFCIVNEWIGKEGKMSWDQVRDLLARGHEIAAHTLSHPELGPLATAGRLDEVRRQVAGSRDDIARRTGFAPRLLCLPGGGTTEDVAEIIRQEGMTQMKRGRCCVGEGFHDIDAYYAEWASNGVERADILTHGVCKAGGGWRPFGTEDEFRQMLDRVAELEREGKVVVTDYAGMLADCRLKAKDWPRHGWLQLSFDDALYAQWEAALPLFRKHGASVTFFCNGEIGTNAVAFMRKVLRDGHDIGLHGRRHRNAVDEIGKLGADAYWAAEVEPQLEACRTAGIPVFSFAYPNGQRDAGSDELFLSHGFTRVRGSSSVFKNPNPYDPKGEKLGLWHSVSTFDPVFRPAVEFHSARLVHNVIMGESYHTDIDDIIRAAQRAGARGEMLALVSHGIGPDAKRINMKTEWLERLLSSAEESGLVVRGVR